MQPNGPGPDAARDAQLERLRSTWKDALGNARTASPGSIAFARLADLAAACAGAWIRAGRRDDQEGGHAGSPSRPSASPPLGSSSHGRTSSSVFERILPTGRPRR